MRIGFDMLAVQSPISSARGIGRYVQQLAAAVLANHPDHDYFLYVHEQLPTDRLPAAPNANLREIRVDVRRGESSLAQVMDRLAQANPDELDVLVVPSPFELGGGYQPPARPANGLKLAAVVYDTILFFFFQNENAADTHRSMAVRPVKKVLGRLYRDLESLRRYDVLLAISEATRQDFLSLLHLPEDRVVTISTGSDGKFFVPDSAPMSDANRQTLKALGIQRPFVLNVSGTCPRKNNEALINAFALLPETLQREYQLVLSFAVNNDYRKYLQRRANAQGIGNALVVTDYVSDETLRLLYQRCAAFVFPSHYEGFGLPILEAMHCGAAVIAGNNSSQIEVVGDAGLLVNVNDPADLAAKLARVLQTPEFAKILRQRAVVQAGKFSWDHTADLTVKAISGLQQPRPVVRSRVRQSRVAKRRIAFFAPFPPKHTGISNDYAGLLQELKQTYEIDLYHETGYVPEPALQSSDFMCCDARLFPRYAPVKNYHAILYQMGNSSDHGFMYETMLRYPGIVTLEDLLLANFELERGSRQGRELDYIRDELLRWYPGRKEEILTTLGSLPWERQSLVEECGRRGWFLNRRIIGAAACTVVHSPWCLEQARAASPADAERVAVIPQAAHTRRISADERAQIRERVGFSQEALVIAAFGVLSPAKMACEALDAFAAVAAINASAVFAFVGEEIDHGAARRHAAELGLAHRVRFLGRQVNQDFCDLVAATDVGICLRRPPTNGETSATLLHSLGSGVATIVTDVATFSDFPDEVVCKVPWDSDGPERLRQTTLGLATDLQKRTSVGSAAREYISQRHDGSTVAQYYVDVIENCHAKQATASPHTGNWSGPISPTHAIAPGAVA